MAKKRITELATETTLKDGQYVAIDHATDGTKKLNLGAELTDLKEETSDLKSALSQDNTYAVTMTANSKWPYAPLGTVTQGTTYSFRYNDLQVSDVEAGTVYLWGETSAQRIIDNIPLGKTVTFTAAQTESVRLIVYLANGTTHRPKISYEFWVTETGRSLSAVVDGLTSVENDLKHFFRFPLILKESDQSNSNVKAVQQSVLGVYLQFETDALEESFWSGTHTYESTTAERNICCATARYDYFVTLYWMNESDTYIAGDQIVKLEYMSPYMNVVDGVAYYKVPLVLDGFNVILHCMIDYEKIPSPTEFTFTLPYDKSRRAEHKRWFYSGCFSNLLPLKQNYWERKAATKATCNAVRALWFQFDSTAAEEAFWSGTHSEGNTTMSRRLGLMLLSSTNEGLIFYWVNERGGSASKAFTISLNDTVLYSSAGMYVITKNVILDGYNVTVNMIVEWTLISSYMTTVGNNVHTIYDRTVSSCQKTLFACLYGSRIARFKSINFGVDGDSITAGNQWSYYVSQALGFNTHHNVAVGSSQWQDEIIVYDGITYYPQIYGEAGWLGMSDGWGTITSAEEAQKRANNSSKNHVLKFIDEVDQGTYPAPDLFVFAFGTNDDPTRLGTVEAAFASSSLPSVSDELLQTTTGAMRWCIQKIHEEYPNCKILWSNPIHSSTDSRENANITKLPVMTEVANKLSVQIIDQWNNSGISGLMEKASAYFLSDGTHPTTEGTKAIARYACSVISTLYFNV